MQTKVTLLLVGLLAVTACAYTYTPEEQQFLWEAFQLQHNKKYSSAFEAVRRFKIFKDALEFIKQHNADSTQTYTVAMNQFGDMTSTEFKAMLGYKPRQLRRSATMLSTEKLADSSSIDWVAQGAVTPVKNQGQCGSCWSFSATGSMEGAVEIASGTLPELSEQQLVDCSTSYGDNGCNGGLMDDAFKYVKAYGGITSESQYPYEASQGSCQAGSMQMVASIGGYQDVTSESPSQMMAALQIGPVSIAIEADQSGFQYYSGGVFSGTCGTNLDHGVLAVGYGTDYSYGDYWKVKNSWGPQWGEQGYIRLARTSTNGPGMCGLLMQPSYPTGAQYIGNDAAAKKNVNGIWTSCAKASDKLSGLNVVITPNPPVKGQTVTVEVTGTLDETVTAGTANLDISVMGIPVVKKSVNICALPGNKVKCPIAAGALDLKVSEAIPSTVPAGDYTGTVTIVDQNGAEITCIKLDLNL